MLQIGSVKLKNWLVMAPMAGITNLPFRIMAKRLGAGLVTTEMISAVGLSIGQERTLGYLTTHPSERPLAVQIFGSTPEVMARAAGTVVDAGADLVDINMGCPVRKVIKTGAGGALLRSPRKVEEIVSAVRRNCNVPLTVKIRAGWAVDQPSASIIAKIVENCGADAITVHPRFVVQGFSGTSDWTIIARVKDQIKIPVIGNGDIFSPSLAFEMKRETGCDGVMIGRGAVGNPWIFRQVLDLERGLPAHMPGLDERRSIIMEHFRLLSISVGETRAAKNMRGLALWYTKGLPYSNRFRGSITGIKDSDTLMSALDRYFTLIKESRFTISNRSISGPTTYPLPVEDRI